MIDTICQIGIFIFGAASIWLVGRKEKWSRWGFIMGMISVPFFAISFYRAGQWGGFALNFWYAYSWSQGVYNHWFRKQ